MSETKQQLLTGTVRPMYEWPKELTRAWLLPLRNASSLTPLLRCGKPYPAWLRWTKVLTLPIPLPTQFQGAEEQVDRHQSTTLALATPSHQAREGERTAAPTIITILTL